MLSFFYYYWCVSFLYSFTGFLWEVRPLPGILQADRKWMAAGSQDRGKHTQKTVLILAVESESFLYKYCSINLSFFFLSWRNGPFSLNGVIWLVWDRTPPFWFSLTTVCVKRGTTDVLAVLHHSICNIMHVGPNQKIKTQKSHNVGIGAPHNSRFCHPLPVLSPNSCPDIPVRLIKLNEQILNLMLLLWMRKQINLFYGCDWIRELVKSVGLLCMTSETIHIVFIFRRRNNSNNCCESDHQR